MDPPQHTKVPVNGFPRPRDLNRPPPVHPGMYRAPLQVRPLLPPICVGAIYAVCRDSSSLRVVQTIQGYGPQKTSSNFETVRVYRAGPGRHCV